jgi:Rps23 Pro-64 3,4-dihydroxylase Tpa1-like proline 4-hydroxylase
MSPYLKPFKHLIIDGFYSDCKDWPEADHPSWVSYDSPLEKKRAFNDLQEMPIGCQQGLFNLLAFSVESKLGIVNARMPDGLFYGAGCHEMGPDGFLDLHLDSDRHPYYGLERRANAILFLSDWKPGWGGELELWEEHRNEPTIRILPRKERLVVFECTDKSFHRVAKVTCPEGVTRRSLAVYWWGHATRPEVKRHRALFLPIIGEVHDPFKSKLREERSLF